MKCIIPLLVIIATGLSWSLPVHDPGSMLRGKRAASNADFKVLCYFVNWSQYRPGNGKYTVEDIDPTLCTHILYAFANIQGNELTIYEYNDVTMYKQLQDLKKGNPALKTLLSVGGATAGQAFSSVASTASNREKFAENVVLYVRKYGFDGVDIDWEYPSAGEKTNFVKMMKEIRFKVQAEAYVTGAEPLLVTCSLGASESVITQSYDLVNLAKHIDFASVMTYDLHGGWDQVTGFQAALIGYSPSDVFNQKWVVEKYLSLHFPNSKLLLGVPTYGRTYTLCNPANNSPRDCSKGFGLAGPYTKSRGILAYNEICEKLKDDWTAAYDVGQRNPYAYKGDQWVGYDDIRSVKDKILYATQESLGGVMFWDLSMDDFGGRCYEGKYPLISEARILMGRTTTTTITTTTTKTTTTTTTITTTNTTQPLFTRTTTPLSNTSITASTSPVKTTSLPSTSSTAPLLGNGTIIHVSSRPANMPTSTTTTLPPVSTSTTIPPTPLPTATPRATTMSPNLTSTIPPTQLPTATPGATTMLPNITSTVPPTTQPVTTKTTTLTMAPIPTLLTTAKTRLSTNGYTPAITGDPVSCPTLFAFLEHPTNCSLFYRCVWGKAIVFHCPRGTYFNLKLPGCDWPSAVMRNCAGVS